MHNVKTAISMEKSLFEKAESLAHTMKVSRSRLIAIALQEYIDRQNNRQLLAQINAAYADDPDATEQTLRRKSRRHHRLIVEGEW